VIYQNKPAFLCTGAALKKILKRKTMLCGVVSEQKTIKKLNSNGIYGVEDLIKYKGNIPGVNIKSLKSKVTKKDVKHISNHSWRDRIAHVIRSKGQVTRVKIGDILVTPHRILLNVSWTEKNTMRRKSVSPICILSNQILWLNQTIISDDEDEDEDDNLPPLENFLPQLQIDKQTLSRLTITEQRAVISLLKETNVSHSYFYE
jgi:hypothetical protein